MSTTDAAEAATQTVKVNGADLIRAVGNVALFASTDDTLPSITAINLRFDGDQLVLEATDRYVAAQQRLEAELELPAAQAEWEPVRINAKSLTEAVKPLARILKSRENRLLADKPSITISYGQGAAFVSVTLTGHVGPDTTMPAEAVSGSYAGEFPRLDHFWPAPAAPADDDDAAEQQQWAGEYVITAHNLAKLTKVVPDDGPAAVRFQFQPNAHKPVPVRVGHDESFRALVMPYKIAA